MKHKYITKQLLLACLSRPVLAKKDIHSQLRETIAERRKILKELEERSLEECPIGVWQRKTSGNKISHSQPRCVGLYVFGVPSGFGRAKLHNKTLRSQPQCVTLPIDLVQYQICHIKPFKIAGIV
jgi:hypothetical protein